jgi:hypothetical protein
MIANAKTKFAKARRGIIFSKKISGIVYVTIAEIKEYPNLNDGFG